eukprot:2052545-Rhodomonas_salina.4
MPALGWRWPDQSRYRRDRDQGSACGGEDMEARNRAGASAPQALSGKPGSTTRGHHRTNVKSGDRGEEFTWKPYTQVCTSRSPSSVRTAVSSPSIMQYARR